ncbi:MAG: 16S rRNA (cytosine(1402)-N(4))-methyltransferase [Leptospiraceae bacterium]|nr:16S rRNA (cytosine(1402)-N(4))-methyltransferase [Leptospiraceae bacterium]
MQNVPMEGNTAELRHIPVLVDEIMAFARQAITPLPSLPNERELWCVDATLGDGGHSLALLGLNERIRVLAFDRDGEMLARARARLHQSAILSPLLTGTDFRQMRSRLRQASSVRHWRVHANYCHAAAWLTELGIQPRFVLLDAGLSLFHYKAAGRGFSYSDSGLDMRLDHALTDPEDQKAAALTSESSFAGQNAEAIPALVWLNQASESEIADCLYQYGEEPLSRRIARSIVQNRPFGSARQLADQIRTIIPIARQRKERIHPATRVFQALRIRTNDELGALSRAVASLSPLIEPGGMFAVISFHSLEDRIVKTHFKTIGQRLAARQQQDGNADQTLEATGQTQKRPKEWKVRRKTTTGDRPGWWILTPRPLRPGESELQRNPASRSACLRVLQRAATDA